MHPRRTLSLPLAALALWLLAQPLSAQPPEREGRHAAIMAKKKEMIASEIALEESQKEPFWALYDEYMEKKAELRKRMLRLREGMAAKSDERLLDDMNALFDLKEQAAKLEREYYGKFQTVLTVRQTTQLYMSEVAFRKRLLRELVRRGVKGVDPDDY